MVDKDYISSILSVIRKGKGEDCIVYDTLCTLHEEGLGKCQNVLVVTTDGEETHYYLAKNETSSDYGDVCMKSRTVLVTGSVAEKDGQMWIAPSKIEAVEKAALPPVSA